MTVSSTSNKVSYTGGTATALPYGFQIYEDTDLKVYKNGTLLTLTSDYTVAGAGSESGGTVTMTAAVVATDEIMIKRELPMTQLIDYQPLDAFPAASHEKGLDRQVMLIQQLNEALERSIKLPDSSLSTADLTLPEPSAGRVIGVWNETAAPSR
jgi:hypothetical protein